MKPGDVVSLKCGGPAMVVTDIYNPLDGCGIATVQWCNTDWEMQMSTVPEECLFLMPDVQTMQRAKHETSQMQ